MKRIITLLILCVFSFGCLEPARSPEKISNPELAKLQGAWRSDLEDIGSGVYLNKEVYINKDSFKEKINAYFSSKPTPKFEDAILIGSLIEDSTITVNPQPNAQGIVEREEVIVRFGISISDETRKNSDKILIGTTSYKDVFNVLLSITSETNNLELKDLTFDDRNYFDLTHKKAGMKNKLGHEFIEKDKFRNYFMKDPDNARADIFGNPFIRQ